MKIQVINEVHIPTINPLNASSDKYYGVIHKYTSDKGFVSALPHNGKFIIFCAIDLTEGSRFSGFVNCVTIQDAVTKAQDNFTIFQFDTYKELFKWLAVD